MRERVRIKLILRFVLSADETEPPTPLNLDSCTRRARRLRTVGTFGSRSCSGDGRSEWSSNRCSHQYMKSTRSAMSWCRTGDMLLAPSNPSSASSTLWLPALHTTRGRGSQFLGSRSRTSPTPVELQLDIKRRDLIGTRPRVRYRCDTPQVTGARDDRALPPRHS